MVPRSILIVEDEGLIALDLQRRLERLGYTVVMLAENMEEALEGVATFAPDLVLMDIRIKGRHDGIETARRITREFDLPIIYVTAHGDAETIERAQLTEPSGYILKPFINVDFRAQIESVLEKKEAERQLRGSELPVAEPFVSALW